MNSRIALFTMEMPKEQIGMRILSNASNINMQRLRNGMLSDDEWMKVGDCLNRLSVPAGSSSTIRRGLRPPRCAAAYAV